MLTAVRPTGKGKSDRFYTNLGLRDDEWNRAKQPSWLLMVAAVAIVGIAFFAGFYGDPAQRAAGWTIGVITIFAYVALDRLRRDRARRHLRHVHGQS